jgi:hypothetical protein
MNIPEGMSYDSKHYLLLTKTIYGIVQSAREFYKKLMSTLKLIGFKGNNLVRVCYQNGLNMES